MSKAEKTKQFIIEQTAPIFNRKGYAGTSLSDMTAATGLTKGSIYGNFSNKDEVALAAFEHNMKQITTVIGNMMANCETAFEKLQVFPEFYRNNFKKEFLELGCPIVNMAPEADDTHILLRDKINETIRNWNIGIQTLVKQGIREGGIRPDVKPAKVAQFMIAGVEGGILISKSTGDIGFLNTALDVIENFLDEIKA